MPEDPEKAGGDETRGDGGEERPTVNPPFDPIAFAKEVLRDSPVKGTPAQRPPPRGALSLANHRIPSDLPKPPRRAAQPLPESFSSLNAVDREWTALEMSTRPPPPSANDGEAADDDVDQDEIPTTPPPRDLAALLPPGQDESAPAVTIDVEEEAPTTEKEMVDRVSLGDYSGALEVAERILTTEPDNAAAKTTAGSCRNILRQMYMARLGPPGRVPIVMVARDQLRWLSIDHRAGFVLSLVDGVSSIEMILDVSGMPELDALRILSELSQQRIIAFR